MAQFSSNNTSRARVLVIDPNNSGQIAVTDKIYVVTVGSLQRLNCYWEWALDEDITDAQYNDHWDLILVPFVQNSGTDYTSLSTAILKFADSSIPVAVMQAESAELGSSITGVSATGSAGTTHEMTTFTWQGRNVTSQYFYGETATTLTSATALATNGVNTAMWQNDIGDHPTLWICGYSGSLDPSSPMFKPWFCFQWMIDQQSTEAKKTALRAKVKPSYAQLRVDGFDIAAINDNLADLQTIYASMVSFGVVEMWCAATGDGPDPGTTDATTSAWWASVNENQGGIMRCTQHHTDVVNDATDKCTSNGIAFDKFDTAGIEYERVCDIFTGTYNIKIGSDGYGKGYPNVQNGNDMNNPSALFLAGGDHPLRVYSATDDAWHGGYGCHLCLADSRSYPTDGYSNPSSELYSRDWAGGQTIQYNSMDGISFTASNVALLVNERMVKSFLNCGGMYWHGLAFSNLVQYIEAFDSNFTACPDIYKTGPWEDQLAELKRGSGVLVDTFSL